MAGEHAVCRKFTAWAAPRRVGINAMPPDGKHARSMPGNGRYVYSLLRKAATFIEIVPKGVWR